MLQQRDMRTYKRADDTAAPSVCACPIIYFPGTPLPSRCAFASLHVDLASAEVCKIQLLCSVLQVARFCGQRAHRCTSAMQCTGQSSNHALFHGTQHWHTSRSSSHIAQAGKGFGRILPRKQSVVVDRQLLTPGKLSPTRLVPAHIPRPPYADTGVLPDVAREPQIHNEEGLKKMRAACRLAAEVLEYAGTLVRPGITTDAIDQAVHDMTVSRGAYPSPLNYGKFPKSVCTSVNECICHGIPDDRPLQNGDIINVDVTVYLDGYHGDTSRMFYVGEVSPKARALCEATKEALDAAIKICGPGVPVKEIGAVISDVAKKHKVTVNRDFIGHGVGRVFHAAPQVLHHRNNSRGTMQVNQTFTIEPIFMEGKDGCKMWADDWTAVTVDGGLAAQYEHTVLITPSGAEVLTVVEQRGETL